MPNKQTDLDKAAMLAEELARTSPGTDPANLAAHFETAIKSMFPDFPSVRRANVAEMARSAFIESVSKGPHVKTALRVEPTTEMFLTEKFATISHKNKPGEVAVEITRMLPAGTAYLFTNAKTGKRYKLELLDVISHAGDIVAGLE